MAEDNRKQNANGQSDPDQGSKKPASGVPFYEQYALLVILGHYGSGKTNLALNLALKLKRIGRDPLLVDLDVVNPYFRTSDYLALTSAEGIRVTGSVFANSSLDAPSLAPGIDSKIMEASLAHPVILDIGGDPDGARALVRYSAAIEQVQNKLVLLVVNSRRPETMSLEGNLEMIAEIQATSGLTLAGIIGNSHLAEFTTPEIIEASLPLLEELANRSAIPLVAVTTSCSVDASLQEQAGKRAYELLSIERLVKTGWQ